MSRALSSQEAATTLHLVIAADAVLRLKQSCLRPFSLIPCLLLIHLFVQTPAVVVEIQSEAVVRQDAIIDAVTTVLYAAFLAIFVCFADSWETGIEGRVHLLISRMLQRQLQQQQAHHPHEEWDQVADQLRLLTATPMSACRLFPLQQHFLAATLLQLITFSVLFTRLLTSLSLSKGVTADSQGNSTRKS